MKSVLALIDILKHSLLSRRILWYTLTYGLIVILISSIAQLYWSYQSELKELENTFVLIEKSHVPGIAASVYALDEEQLNIHMEGVLYSRDVAYLEVVQFSGDQQIVSSIGHSDLSSPLIRTFSLEQANLDGVISRYGMLSVAVDMSKVYQRLWSNGWKFLLMTVAVVGVIAFGVFLFIHFMLTRHLITMARFY
ncbi:MAG: hypothetical protein H8E21_14980, partial [Gammaproteobacteria bacterium]|nr:hypothetical protein [Gammaproteobacteria bacterium]